MLSDLGDVMQALGLHIKHRAATSDKRDAALVFPTSHKYPRRALDTPD